MEDLHTEERAAMRQELANKELQQHANSQERMRPGLQLEASENWANFPTTDQMGQTMGNSGLSNSTVVINGASQAAEEMEDTGQI